MEDLMNVIGATALVLLVIVGALAGTIAGMLAGRRHLLYIVAGMAGAVALPFILAAMGVGALLAGGLLVILLAAAVGAVIVLALVRAVIGRGS